MTFFLPLRVLVTLLLFVPVLVFSAEQHVAYQITNRHIEAKPPTLKVKRNEVEKIHLPKYLSWYNKQDGVVVWE